MAATAPRANQMHVRRVVAASAMPRITATASQTIVIVVMGVLLSWMV